MRISESGKGRLSLFALLTRKADGLIVALSGNLERPLVGQSGTFLEPGSANLITFEVGTLTFYINANISGSRF